MFGLVAIFITIFSISYYYLLWLFSCCLSSLLRKCVITWRGGRFKSEKPRWRPRWRSGTKASSAGEWNQISKTKSDRHTKKRTVVITSFSLIVASWKPTFPSVRHDFRVTNECCLLSERIFIWKKKWNFIFQSKFNEEKNEELFCYWKELFRVIPFTCCEWMMCDLLCEYMRVQVRRWAESVWMCLHDEG